MKKSYLLFYLLSIISLVQAQSVKLSYYNQIPILNKNGTDTLQYPFTGGLNAAQFSAIDLDGDGIKDLFVFDRAGNKILTFLFKNGKYIYTPKYESMFPELNSWVLLRDYNCDGKMDIFTEVDHNAQPDKSKFIYSGGIRVIQNVSTKAGEFKWLQTQNQLYDTGSQTEPPVNISLASTDLPAIEDIDNDGDMDLLIMPLAKNVITYYQNLSKEKGYNCDSLIYVFRDECWGYIYYKVVKNEFALNDMSPCSRNYFNKTMHNGTTLCLYDKDNDGDKDLLYGDVSYNSLLLLENGKSINKKNLDSIISQDTIFPRNTKAAVIEFPAAYMLDVDGDTKKDMLITTNMDGSAKNKDNISFYKNTGTATVPAFQYQRNNFLIEEMIDLGGGSFPTFVDIDSDGDVDLVVSTQGEFTQTSNSNDYLVLYKNTGTPTKPVYQLSDTNFLSINNSTQKILRIMPSFGDLTGDGKPDLLIGDLNGKMHFYQNISNGLNINYIKLSGDYFGMYGGTSAAPQLVDLNKDGKLDIVMGRKNGTLAYFENNGTITAPNFSTTPTIDSIGKFTVAESVLSGGVPYYFDGYSMPYVCDLDKDGRYEVLVGSEQGRIFLYNNFEANPNRKCAEIDKIFTDDPSAAAANLKFGTRASVTTADINKDGKFEIIIGNQRGGLRVYQAQISGVISGVKLQQVAEPTFVIYPNPAKELLTIKGDYNLNGMKYTIVNLIGEVIGNGEFTSYLNELNVSDLLPGLYIISASNINGQKLNARFLIR
ncbi:MAG: T9SS type A sorting domain-containing protein [Bacteroidia bacterium]|nr:T9SS type A sorting domain-containing protein [Bacteroidia bacterium]